MRFRTQIKRIIIGSNLTRKVQIFLNAFEYICCMRKIWMLLAPLLTQCSGQTDKQIRTGIIYQTDTVYVEKPEEKAKYPWDLECMDTADTQLDMNICSLDCSLVADSLTEKMYHDILSIYDENIKESTDEEYCLNQKERIKIIHEHFRIIRKAASDYKYATYEGGSMAPLMVNSVNTAVFEIEFELLDNLKFEAEQM